MGLLCGGQAHTPYFIPCGMHCEVNMQEATRGLVEKRPDDKRRKGNFIQRRWMIIMIGKRREDIKCIIKREKNTLGIQHGCSGNKHRPMLGLWVLVW